MPSNAIKINQKITVERGLRWEEAVEKTLRDDE